MKTIIQALVLIAVSFFTQKGFAHQSEKATALVNPAQSKTYSAVLQEADLREGQKYLARKALLKAIQDDDLEKAIDAFEMDIDCNDEVNNKGDYPEEDTWKKSTHALIRAARQGNQEAINELKTSGIKIVPVGLNAPINKISDYICNKPTGTFLHHATCRGWIYMISLFILKQANVEKESQGRPPLHTAVITNNLLAVSVILQAGANVHQESSTSGDQAIHLAAGAENVAILRLLIKAGASVHAKTMLGDEPLHIAAEIGNRENVEELIKHGADITAPDLLGLTPIDRAVRALNVEALAVFAQHIPQANPTKLFIETLEQNNNSDEHLAITKS